MSKIDPQHCLHWIRGWSAITTGLGVVEIDQVGQQLPRHNSLHLGLKFLPWGPLFGGGLLVNTKTELLGAHEA
jgi:hypothetical protein